MTKIPSVEEVKKMGLQKKQGQATVYCYTQTQLENILINQRTALLTELRDSGLLEEVKNKKIPQDFEKFSDWVFYEGKHVGHNTLARAIKAHLNNLINPGVWKNY